MHARLLPARNSFKYGIYYLALPLSELEQSDIARDRFSLTSFYGKDHGPRNGDDLLSWARYVLFTHGVTAADGEIVLVCMPRILGYVFNPVSFWICYDKNQAIRAVICEVRNTFGENHSYLCAHEDGRPIDPQDLLSAQKIFHVSPFLKREGHYQFRFDITDNKFGVWIDYYDGAGEKILITALCGNFMMLTKSSLRRAFWKHPLVTLKAIYLIHWQAIKLLGRGVKYIPKPLQKKERMSATGNITKI